MFVNKSGP